MGLYKPAGRQGKNDPWYYSFYVNGKRKRGSTKETVKAKAQQVEDDLKANFDIKASDKERHKVKSVTRILEDVKESVAGKGLGFNEAFKIYEKRKRAFGEKKISLERWEIINAYWADFVYYCEQHEIKNTSRVTIESARNYVEHLREYGKAKQKTNYKPTDRTIFAYITVLKDVFNKLIKEGLCLNNPFDEFKAPATKAKESVRQVFNDYELDKILKFVLGDCKLPRSKTEHDQLNIEILRGSVIVILHTTLRRGDVANMLWEDIDLLERKFTPTLRKTGAKVTIPIEGGLYNYLYELQIKRDASPYVFPEYKAYYEDKGKRPHISRKFKQMLNHLGINGLKTSEGKRDISVLDIHSLRHVAVHKMSLNGVNPSVIKMFTGHTSDSMVDLYSNHDSNAAQLVASRQLANINLLDINEKADLKNEVLSMVDTATPEQLEQIKILLGGK